MKNLILFSIIVLNTILVSCGNGRKIAPNVPYYTLKTEPTKYTSANLGSNCPVFDLKNQHGSTLFLDLFIPATQEFTYYFSIIIQSGGKYHLPGVYQSECANIGATYGVDPNGERTGAGELEKYFKYTNTVSRECSNFIQNNATWASIAWDNRLAKCTIIFYTGD